MTQRSAQIVGSVLFLAACLLPAAPVHALEVLVYDNNSQSQTALTAATNLGLPFTRAMSGDFVTQLTGGTAWDLVVLDLPSNEPAGAWQSSLETFIASGGRVIHSMWNGSSLTPTLQAAFEVTSVGAHQTQTFYRWNMHPLFSSPNTIDDTFDVWQDLWGTNGFYFEPVGTAVAAAGFRQMQSPGQAAIVIGNSSRTIFNGFLFDDYDIADKDMDGKKDIVELLENEMLFILGPSCSITAPGPLATVDSDVTLTFDANDPEMDPLIATFEFSTDGGVTFSPCAVGASSPHMNPTMQFSVPATGEGFVWDSIADGVGFVVPQITEVRIAVTDTMDNGSCSIQVEVDNVIPTPVCTVTEPTGTSGGDISIDFTALSISTPFVNLVFEHSIDGGATWLPATAAVSSTIPNPAMGIVIGASTFVWDSAIDGVGSAVLQPGVLVQLTVTDGIALLPGICVSGAFDVDNTQLCGGICGDCNQNMVGPDVLDALAASQISVLLIVPTPEQEACCDVNVSGIVDVVDALLIAQVDAGLMATLMCA